MKKWGKYFLWTGIIAGIFFIFALIFSFYYIWSASAQVKQKLAAIREDGDPICLADFARKPIPPEQNGATYLLQAKDDLNAAVNKIYDLKSFQEYIYDPADMKIIKDSLDAYPKVYPLLQQAAACPDFDSKLDYNLPPRKLMDAILDQINSGFRRTPGRYLLARAKMSIFQNDREEALRSVILQLQLSRQLEREPLILTNYLVTIATKHIALECSNEILQSGPVGDQARAALDAELSLHGSMDKCRMALKHERAYSMDMLIHELPRPFLLANQWQLYSLNMFEEFLKFSSKPLSDWVSNSYLQPQKSGLMLSGPVAMAIPALKYALVCAYRNQAMIRAIRILNALQKKAPIDSDKIPTMAELGLPDEVGIDPFNGKTMIIKKLPQGWLVYSVGENLQDDGGEVEEESNNKPLDVGFGPKIPEPKSQEK